MNPNQLQHRRRGSAFSLVEVTLAIGIVSFCLVSLLGLFAVGLESSRKSGDDTILSGVAIRLMNELSRPGTSLATSGFIDDSGEINATEGAYEYEITVAPVEAPEITPASEDLRQISVIFRWPVGADEDFQETMAFHSALFNPAGGGATP